MYYGMWYVLCMLDDMFRHACSWCCSCNAHAVMQEKDHGGGSRVLIVHHACIGRHPLFRPCHAPSVSQPAQQSRRSTLPIALSNVSTLLSSPWLSPWLSPWFPRSQLLACFQIDNWIGSPAREPKPTQNSSSSKENRQTGRAEPSLSPLPLQFVQLYLRSDGSPSTSPTPPGPQPRCIKCNLSFVAHLAVCPH
ncbi:hypothetical protein AUP68_05027 [Ilyonectria robusta]